VSFFGVGVRQGLRAYDIGRWDVLNEWPMAFDVYTGVFFSLNLVGVFVAWLLSIASAHIVLLMMLGVQLIWRLTYGGLGYFPILKYPVLQVLLFKRRF
jgi:hypothetical protein